MKASRTLPIPPEVRVGDFRLFFSCLPPSGDRPLLRFLLSFGVMVLLFTEKLPGILPEDRVNGGQL